MGKISAWVNLHPPKLIDPLEADPLDSSWSRGKLAAMHNIIVYAQKPFKEGLQGCRLTTAAGTPRQANQVLRPLRALRPRVQECKRDVMSERGFSTTHVLQCTTGELDIDCRAFNSIVLASWLQTHSSAGKFRLGTHDHAQR
jgi:hypothetical protein